MRRTRNLLIPLLAAFLGGCEGDQAQQDATETAAAARRAKQADPTADMVTAVSPATARAPVELKFLLGNRPEVGKPLDVEIAVLPVSDVDRISAIFQVGPGLELRQGGQMAVIENPEPNAAINHKITLVPLQDGIFFVSATVHVDSPTQSLTRTFSFPVIAGAGAPPAGDGSDAPEKPQ
jgi:hypothetical protein